MRIIAVMSPKGGIGKTTTSDSIAYMLGEEQGKRVLVLDLSLIHIFAEVPRFEKHYR